MDKDAIFWLIFLVALVGHTIVNGAIFFALGFLMGKKKND
jgi:hypothetical protein